MGSRRNDVGAAVCPLRLQREAEDGLENSGKPEGYRMHGHTSRVITVNVSIWTLVTSISAAPEGVGTFGKPPDEALPESTL